MIIPAKVQGGTVIHSAIDMGGFYYIVCHADRTTLKTEIVSGEITCKKCLSRKSEVFPDYHYSEHVNAVDHPFFDKNKVDGCFYAGYYDGKHNLRKKIPKTASEDNIADYEKGYLQGMSIYTYHFKNGDTKDRPVSKAPNGLFPNDKKTTTINTTKNAGCATLIISVFTALLILIFS
jgi:hypothetical protein